MLPFIAKEGILMHEILGKTHTYVVALAELAIAL